MRGTGSFGLVGLGDVEGIVGSCLKALNCLLLVCGWLLPACV